MAQLLISWLVTHMLWAAMSGSLRGVKVYKHRFLPPLLKIRKILWNDLCSHALNKRYLLKHASQHLFQTSHLPPSPPSQCFSWTTTSSAYLDTIFLTHSTMTFMALPHLPFVPDSRSSCGVMKVKLRTAAQLHLWSSNAYFSVPYSLHWSRSLVEHESLGNVGKLTEISQSPLWVFLSLTLMQHLTFEEDWDILFEVEEVLQAKIQVTWMPIKFGICIQKEGP